jgi:ferredoxin
VLPLSTPTRPRPPCHHEFHHHPAARGPQLRRRARRTLLAAAIRQGIGLPYGCRDGACGSCKSRLLEGRVIHGAHQLKACPAEEEAAAWC